MRVGALVLARTDSRRLPGKALADIGGRPLLARVLECVRRVRGLDTVVVTTSERPVDDELAALAAREGADVFRGAAEDLLGRCLAAARHFELDAVMRVSGDSPFFDSALAERMLTVASETGADLTTNVAPRTFPPGWSVEILTLAALEALDGAVTDPEGREHVTGAAYRRPGLLEVHNVSADRVYPSVRLTVDTPEDLERARWIQQALGTGRYGSQDIPDLAVRYDGGER